MHNKDLLQIAYFGQKFAIIFRLTLCVNLKILSNFWLKIFNFRHNPYCATGLLSKTNIEKIPVNNFIRAKEVRVIDETGAQLGVMNIFSAIDLAKSKSLDLIQVTEKVEPPVCRIGNYGKYLYSLKKKEKKIHIKTKTELKEIRIGFNISPHDIEVKSSQAEKFLKDGNKVKVSMFLKGREKAMGELAKKKVLFFLENTDKLIPIKTERELKREPKGFTMIISRK